MNEDLQKSQKEAMAA